MKKELKNEWYCLCGISSKYKLYIISSITLTITITITIYLLTIYYKFGLWWRRQLLAGLNKEMSELVK